MQMTRDTGAQADEQLIFGESNQPRMGNEARDESLIE